MYQKKKRAMAIMNNTRQQKEKERQAKRKLFSTSEIKLL